MARGESTDVEFVVAHAAMKFIAAKGLTDEFYRTFGQHCDSTCMHEPTWTKTKSKEQSA